MLSYFGDLLTKVFYHNDDKDKEKEKETKENLHIDEYDIIEKSTSPQNNTHQLSIEISLNSLSVIENQKEKEENANSIIQKPKNILDIIIDDDNRFKIFNKYRAIRIKKYECNFSKHKLMVKKRPNTRKKNFRTLQ